MATLEDVDADMLARWRSAAAGNADRHVLLALDQVEDLFVTTSPGLQRTFLSQLEAWFAVCARVSRRERDPPPELQADLP